MIEKNDTRPILVQSKTDLKREKKKARGTEENDKKGGGERKKETTRGESGEHHNSISEYYVSITLRSGARARKEGGKKGQKFELAFHWG